MKLFYNEATKVIFGSDSEQGADMREITRDEIPDLIANGAVVDASANEPAKSATAGDAGNVVDSSTSGASVLSDGSSTSTATQSGLSPTGEQGNVSDSSTGTASGSTPSQDAPAASAPGAPATDLVTDADVGGIPAGTVAVPPVTPAGTPVAPSQPTAVTSEGHEDAQLIGDKPAGDYASCGDHTSLLGRLLGDLEGAVHMGKSEIIALIDAARNAFEG